MLSKGIISQNAISDMARAYHNRGFIVLPLNGKRPITKEWQHLTIEDFDEEACANGNIGLATGSKSGFFVVDVDTKEGGVESWQKLAEAHSLPSTATVETGSGGLHVYFKIPKGITVKNSVSKIAPGVDVRGEGGQVVAPPSVHPETHRPYNWVDGLSLDDVGICDAPRWLIDLLNEKNDESVIRIGKPKATSVAQLDKVELTGKAIGYLGRILPSRADNYEEWVKIGMCLRGLGDVGLALWDEWSKKSGKYRPGDCQHKWETFEPNDGVTLGTLAYLAEQDSPEGLKEGKRGAKPSEYKSALKAFGHTFALNDANDDVYVNGVPLNDVLESSILYDLSERGYTNEKNARLAIAHDANLNRFHPVVDYLTDLEWDGEDHITQLTSYFKDKDNVFPIWVKRWLIGAVAKVLATPKGQQNRMLVLDGRQDLGKSYFARWLCSPLPAFYLESPIDTRDKDARVRLMSTWIWEVGELGATTRKEDREALKGFLTEQNVTVRRSYGHHDITKPAMANFIGTVNNENGFLSDPTGNRRFMVTTLESIDWGYSRDVDVNQLWAQAKSLYLAGEPWRLSGDEGAMASAINSDYEVESPLLQYFLRYFDVDPSRKDLFLPTSEIRDILEKEGVSETILGWSDRAMASALRPLGVERARKRHKNYSSPVWGWSGIKRKTEKYIPG